VEFRDNVVLKLCCDLTACGAAVGLLLTVKFAGDV